jgi:hypothetical protein
LNDHNPAVHTVELIEEVADQQMALMQNLVREANHKQDGLQSLFPLIDNVQQRLMGSYQTAKNQIEENANFMIKCIESLKKDLEKDLETTFGCRHLQIAVIDKEVQKTAKKMSQTIEFTERLMKFSSPTEILIFKVYFMGSFCLVSQI